MSHVHVGIAQNHFLASPSTQLHERHYVAICRIVPSRPRVAAVMRRQVDNTRATTSPMKRGLDLAAASVSLPGGGFTIRAPEDLLMATIDEAKASDKYGKGGGLVDGDLIREFPVGTRPNALADNQIRP